ncbi:S8 family peptidase [Glycomyces sp. L485]|uniref:S8 family peptidase n=1 Tax=Glycomyces sp. L485 TaxID=2909235 RepID=UPI001F4B5F02|nr:S8 family peptidase [Glycomyces sp. L485]MCH7232037.1 S8 family peptidase [Glycomyces sp. L485]
MTAAATAVTLAVSPVQAESADIIGADSPDAIPGEYIVAFKDEAVPVEQLVTRFDGRIESRFDSVHAVSVHMEAADAERLAAHPAVEYVEQNTRIEIAATQLNPPGWGLDRVDQRSLPLDGSYTYPNAGDGVHAYIIDTGIWLDEVDFAGRLDPGYSAVVPGGNSRDCHGHGTHVAGIVGGELFGIAKQTQLVPVQVFNCSGVADAVTVIGGVEWVTQNAVKPAVANMSLSGGASQTLDTAVSASIDSGVTYVVAAGNADADACGYSPARLVAALTVAAADANDVRGGFSNFGSCVDLFAPGVNVRSNYLFNVTVRRDGTSIAAPHVAGAAAVYLSANPTASPATVASALIGDATSGVITDPAGSPNRLVYITA